MEKVLPRRIDTRVWEKVRGFLENHWGSSTCSCQDLPPWPEFGEARFAPGRPPCRFPSGRKIEAVSMDWHRLFGLILTDFFTDSPFVVELEKDLSKQKQPLDVIIFRRAPGSFAGRLPDGLDNLAAHNLITFKSHRDALDDWALK